MVLISTLFSFAIEQLFPCLSLVKPNESMEAHAQGLRRNDLKLVSLTLYKKYDKVSDGSS